LRSQNDYEETLHRLMIMAKIEDTLTTKPLRTLSLIGLLLWLFFLIGFAGFYYYVGVLGQGGVDVFIAFMPLWFFSYLVVISVYTGLLMSRLAQGRWKYPGLWGISGGILTSLLIVGLPILFSSVFPYLSVAILSFLAPLLSVLLIGLLISIRRKATL
jgi:hypothetical protein